MNTLEPACREYIDACVQFQKACDGTGIKTQADFEAIVVPRVEAVNPKVIAAHDSIIRALEDGGWTCTYSAEDYFERVRQQTT